MELGLRLGSEASIPSELVREVTEDDHIINKKGSNLLGFCMARPKGDHKEGPVQDDEEEEEEEEEEEAIKMSKHFNCNSVQESKHHLIRKSDHQISLIQLDLLPNAPVPRNHDHLNPRGSINVANNNGNATEAIDIIPSKTERVDLELELEHHNEDESSSPPNSGASLFRMDFSLSSNKLMASVNNDEGDRDNYGRTRRGSSRGSDEEENGSTRKKLRLSKEQSAFLEDNFKEHSTLNPKQKLALAKQLNLRPRQVEVWFQNRRARTKLKQTELDCDYLKRCCETLTEENRRLHKELQELRAFKTSNPFYKRPPATTLTMCPSCERVSSSTNNSNNNSTTNSKSNNTNATITNSNSMTLSRPRLSPFSLAKPNNQEPAS